MELIGGRLMRQHHFYGWVCIHEKHWTDDAMLADVLEQDPDICWECIHAVEELTRSIDG
jgi:hypothetical protein